MPFSAVDCRAAGSLLLALALTACAGAVASPPQPPLYRVTASGRIHAGNDARFLVAEQDGRIESIAVEEGDTVRAGQVLPTIACRDLAAQGIAAAASADAAAASARLVAAGPRDEAREEAFARARQAEAALVDARDLLARSNGLAAQGFVSQRRLTELANMVAGRAADAAAAGAAARAIAAGARPDERRVARAQAAAAAASAQGYAARVDRCTLRSPVAGTVLKLLHRSGEFSAASTGVPLVVVGDLEAVVVRAEIADRDAAQVSAGGKVDVWMDGSPQRWRGTIVRQAQLMGRKTARSLDPSDRFDRDVREVIIGFPAGRRPPALVGLRVNVGIRT